MRKRLKSAEAAGSADNLESTASGPTPPEDFTGELGDAAELRRLEEALAVGKHFIGHNTVAPYKPHPRIWHGFCGVRYYQAEQKWRVKVPPGQHGEELPGRHPTLVAAATALATRLGIQVSAAALPPVAPGKAGGSSHPSSGPSRQPNAGAAGAAAAPSAQRNRNPGKRPATASAQDPPQRGVRNLDEGEKELMMENLAQRQREVEEAEDRLRRKQAEVDQRDRATTLAAAELEAAAAAAKDGHRPHFTAKIMVPVPNLFQS